ncbi:hypothetical protein VTN77DRAFT_6898 [Rasamsonia byssochlamydoides]|uniref:uncharacterized protein n=1 Tax=Rasamsonia byssochlamydoides TaxID=89139 RepID=UPI0037435562
MVCEPGEVEATRLFTEAFLRASTSQRDGLRGILVAWPMPHKSFRTRRQGLSGQLPAIARGRLRNGKLTDQFKRSQPKLTNTAGGTARARATYTDVADTPRQPSV